MPKKRKLASVDDKCRVCLGDDGCMIDIFSEDIKPKIYALGESTSTHIYNDENLPRNICHVCLYKLDMWIEFKRQFLRSHEMLREHLGLADLSDDAVSPAKRKHTEEASKDSPDAGAAKKIKLVEMKSEPADEVIADAEVAEKPLANNKPASPEDTSCKNISDTAEGAERMETSETASRSIRLSSPTKQTSGRRGKTTERREASTKRWVARKRALLAATGENETDTDSETSDEAQLSPVRKARAKCNAEKVAKNLKTFEESEPRESKERDVTEEEKKEENRSNDADEDAKDEKIIETKKDEAVADSEQTREDAQKNTSANEDKESVIPAKSAENFLPHSVRSELTIDEATYIVTSTLVLQEPHYLSPVTLPQALKEDTDRLARNNEEANQEQRNTDIIDAVQLRRVPPKSATGERKYLERCLNIEVEGTELEALQRVQKELANFVETKLFTALGDACPSRSEEARNVGQSLDQQLKTIVEKSIKKNLENSRNERASSSSDNRGNNTFTGDFVKAAMRSRIFQPRVLLVRCEDRPVVRCANTCEPSLGKRRSIVPAKFADYDGSPFNTASDEARDVSRKNETPVTTNSRFKLKTYGARGTSQQSENARETSRSDQALSNKNSQTETKIAIEKTITSTNTSTTTTVPSTSNSAITEKHICGVCGESYGSRREVEIHFTAHKGPPVATIRQVKQKMMRCKRCHEIVEARYVKLHVCNSPRNTINKCRLCEATFRNDKLLANHLETHAVTDKTVKIEASSSTTTTTGTTTTATTTNALAPSSKETRGLESNAARSQSPIKKRPLREILQHGNTGDTYTCFVCDKIFEGEKVLKDHLQKHCDDMSVDEDEDEAIEEEEEDGATRDEDRANATIAEAERYQCAICGESLRSEDALESHVEKHLFDDEDDNPNLISIVERRDDECAVKARNVYECAQCDETFDSEMLLMLHVQAHEEEVAIAEWERRGVDDSRDEQHTCVICDEVFVTEAELSEHLDVHNGNAHVCQLCDKPFITLEELRAHVDTH